MSTCYKDKQQKNNQTKLPNLAAIAETFETKKTIYTQIQITPSVWKMDFKPRSIHTQDKQDKQVLTQNSKTLTDNVRYTRTVQLYKANWHVVKATHANTHHTPKNLQRTQIRLKDKLRNVNETTKGWDNAKTEKHFHIRRVYDARNAISTQQTWQRQQQQQNNARDLNRRNM